ncbi:MAG: hypothetical protein MI725_14030 [Pirellulales bacterium]|nr:hypothetical protein [Pirellulales bacterium]
MLHQQLSLILGHAVRSEARLYLPAHPDADVVRIAGRLRGPVCDFARTLSADYGIQQLPNREDQTSLAQILIPDPCYWTPQLPFQYDLQVEWQNESGAICEQTTNVGLRRWAAEGRHLRLERARIVLRGAGAESPTWELFEEARAAETALLVSSPSDSQCATASRLGVPLVVDLRRAGQQLVEELQRFAWRPAALVVLLENEQLPSESVETPGARQFLLAQSITTQTTEEAAQTVLCDLYAVQLGPGERPPAWLANCAKPAIAVRREAAYPELKSARAASDRLQAELAPEFDLAGYFVAP